MLYEAKTVTMKNGKTALFRSTCKEDAAQMIEYMKTCFGETDFLLRYPEEFDIAPEREAAFLESVRNSEYDLMIVCEIDGEIAGNCHLSRHNKMKTRHRADVAIALVEKYCSLGIGTQMFTELIEAAKQQGIEQLELEVMEGNDRAIGLYKKMGFEVVGARPDGIRLKDGTMLKEFWMVKKL